MNRYLLRTVDSTLAFSPVSVLAYTNLCGMLHVGFIHEPRRSEWKGSKIHVRKGTLEVRDLHVPDAFGDFPEDRAREAMRTALSVSPRQQSRIDEFVRRDAGRAAGSESFRAMMLDVSVFGDRAFSGDS